MVEVHTMRSMKKILLFSGLTIKHGIQKLVATLKMALGKKLDLSFMAALKGAESDNFNTMIATGSYPDIIDLSYSNDSPKNLYEEGITN